MMLYAITVTFIVLFATAITFAAIRRETEEYNNGICPDCGKPLKYCYTDLYGGKLYCCSECRYTTKISFRCVDKKKARKSK